MTHNDLIKAHGCYQFISYMTQINNNSNNGLSDYKDS